MPVRPRPVIDRLLARTVEDGNGCWVFTGARFLGYGVIGLGGRKDGTGLTHRVSYRYFIGDIPPGLDLDHLCRNRACCNPWHLEPVSRQVNVDRGLRSKAEWAKRRTHCALGHPLTTRPRANGTVRRDCPTCRKIKYHEKKRSAA